MEIFKDEQYNNSIGKYKVLSSTAGVGSIITTKIGYFIMPLSISDWAFIKRVNTTISKFHLSTPEEIAEMAGVDLINDPRFIDFLRAEQSLKELILLVDVPHVTIDNWNYIKYQSHPLYIKYKEQNGMDLPKDHFIIPAIHFPRWFYSKKHLYLKPLQEWARLWETERCDGGNLKYFAPPRDPYSKSYRTFKDKNRIYDYFDPLAQVPMLLICKNGHISDIPWYNLFCAGIDGKKDFMVNPEKDPNFNLFTYENECEKGGKHELQWIENRNSSESWGTIKCNKCKKSFSLEGIMNIQPYCTGETPWNGIGTKDENVCQDSDHNRTKMQVALVTSNSIYYANSFSSLYIPTCYLEFQPLSSTQLATYNLLVNNWYHDAIEETPELTKKSFIANNDIKRFARIAGINLTDEDKSIIIKRFTRENDSNSDKEESYRYEEFKAFSTHDKSIGNHPELVFKDIDLPDELNCYFNKIKQVESLAITTMQLGFNRVSIPSPKRINGEVVKDDGQNIFKGTPDSVLSLPANQVYGEGLYFEFDMEKIENWVGENIQRLNERYNNRSAGFMEFPLYAKMLGYGAPMFYLLHTFSHLILKELEFSCGYPAASLKERLYYSNRMCGVLIYTADGSEGSMGGLVWLGQPQLISKIIASALERAEGCSSDPLCWENDESLNLAACFSCCYVSETSCEERNLALDRQVLINSDFGFFKDYK